jgi:hypothetical protein
MEKDGISRPGAVDQPPQVDGLFPRDPPDIDVDTGRQKGFDRLYFAFPEQDGRRTLLDARLAVYVADV